MNGKRVSGPRAGWMAIRKSLRGRPNAAIFLGLPFLLAVPALTFGEQVAIARWEHGSVEPAQFREYLDRVRLPGYRPASSAEARRLLDRLVLERLVEQALADSEEGAPSKRSVGKIGLEAGLKALAERRKVSQGDVARELLRAELVQVDDAVLETFVVRIDEKAGPPMPPPLAAARTAEGAGAR